MFKNYSLAVYDYQDKKLCDLANENISIKGEAYNINFHQEINGYKELTFNLPAKIEDENGNLIDNFRLDFIKNDYKVKLKKDGKTYDFIIKKVQRQRDSRGVLSYSVQCVCAAFDKLSKSGLDLYFEYETGNAKTLLTKILDGSDWSVGKVDTFIQDGVEKYRTLNGEKTSRFSLIQELCDLFEAYPIFHTDTKTVDLLEDIGEDNGVQFRYNKNLKEIVQNIESDEIITKLWVEGGEHPDYGLTLISTENPTGENYILNFQYYIDLGLLSPEQITAINQFQSNITNINNVINGLLSEISDLTLDKMYRESERESKEIAKVSKQQMVTELNYRITITKDETVRQELLNRRDKLQSEINTLINEISNLNIIISNLSSQIAAKEAELSVQYNNKKQIIKNLESAVGDFIREGIYQNTNYIDSKALYADALEVSQKLAYPRVSYEVNILDLSRLTGFEAEKFGLGDKVYIIDESLNINTKGRITVIDEVLDNPAETQVTISNFVTTFEDLFKRVFTATHIINAHKEIYNRVKAINADGTLNYDLLQKTFDNNMFRVRFGTNNKVITDERGITIEDIEDPNKIVRINAGGIFITSDGGQSWKQAVSADGISALNIVSGLIDTKVLQIWNSSRPTFYWDADGLRAINPSNQNQWIQFNDSGLRFTRNGGQTYEVALSFDGLYIGSNTNFEPGYSPDDIKGYAATVVANLANGLYPGGTFINGNSVISPNIIGGNIIGSVIRTADTANRLELSEGSFKAYSSGVKRAELDYDSLIFYTPSGYWGGRIYGRSSGGLHIGGDHIYMSGTTGVEIISETSIYISALAGYGSGNLSLKASNNIIMTGSNITFNGNKVWHAGNDGSGSGSDADYLDGKDSSYFQPASDIRLKTNIQPITNALEKVLQLQGVIFDWNEKAQEIGAKRDTLSGHEIGLIAQDVAQVVPEVVLDWIKTPDGEIYQTVDTSRMVALVVEAIKELNTKIENIRTEINEIKGVI